jgi:uncharacterized protein YbaR (Trm112 family)
MKKEMLAILACPVCRQSLSLSMEEQEGEEVISGSLYCKKCQRSYPIATGIPDLLCS